MDCCLGRKIPVVAFDPSDKTLTIYKYFSNLILKRCYEAGLDVFRSRIMLISNGELLDNTIGMLKPTGVQVYAANTTEKNNKDYILKHLPELDAIIVADYPEKSESIIGRDSLIEIDDLIEINSDVTVIHLAGKVDARSLEFNSIKYIPKIIKPNSLNVNFSEFGIRAISDLSVGVLGAAGSFIKTKNLTMPSKGHIVSYIILNKENHGLLNF